MKHELLKLMRERLFQDLRGSRETKEIRGIREPLVQLALRAQRGLVVLKASEVFKVFREFQVRLARRVLQELLVLRGLPAR